MKCITRGVLVFLVVFGSLGGFLSAFSLEFNVPVVAACLFLCALYFSALFLFGKSWKKDIGYIVFFLFYATGILYCKAYANSGFAAVVNAVRTQGELYFDLEPGEMFNEIIENRYLTITVLFLYIGMFEIIFLNIFVSNYLSLKIPVFVALFLYAIPLYFQLEVPVAYILCMLAGLGGIAVFRYNNRRVYWAAAIPVLACAAAVAVFTTFFTYSDWNSYYVENEYKEATREGVSGFVALGFGVFFKDRYAKGGVGGGNLAEIRNLRPTGETHLRVKFTPYDTKPVYLKAYTGYTYRENKWLDSQDMFRMGFEVDYHVRQGLYLMKAFGKNQKQYARGTMEILNVGANPEYYYLPYFPDFSGMEQSYNDGSWQRAQPSPGKFYVNARVRVPYYPVVSPLQPTGAKNGRKDIGETEFMYDGELYLENLNIYGEMPAENLGAVEEVCRAAGVSLPPLRNGVPERRTETENAIEKIVEYLKNNYTYSYSPGQVPAGRDAVEYFLAENKKGVCAHFASAAALILRRLGYHVRYAEGYLIDNLYHAQKQEGENYKEYYSGYSPAGETAVIETEVKDTDAHAWVEASLENGGWTVIDPTPGISEPSGGSALFWDSLQGLLGNSPEVDLGGGMDFLKGAVNSRIWRAALITAVFATAVFLGRKRVAGAVLLYRSMHTGNLRKNLFSRYRHACRKRAKKDPEFAALSMPSEQIAYLLSHTGEKSALKDVKIMSERFEAALFSPTPLSGEEYRAMRSFLKSM